MLSGTHSAKRERAKAKGFGSRTENKFLFQVRVDLSAERHPPFGAQARLCRNLFSFAHPPSLSTQCQAAPQVRVHLTTVFLFRYPRRSGLAELTALCEGTILADDDVKTARYQYDLLGRGTGYWVFHILCTLSFPLASLSLPSALFQALRRHRCRLLRQRLFSLTPCRVVVVSGIAFQHDFAAKRGTSGLVGSGRRWSRLDWAAAQSEQSCCRHGVFAEKTTRRDRAHAVAGSIIAERVTHPSIRKELTVFYQQRTRCGPVGEAAKSGGTLQPQFRGCDARSPHRFSIVVYVLPGIRRILLVPISVIVVY